MLLLLDPVDQGIDGPSLLAQDPGCGLAMEDTSAVMSEL